MREAVNLCKHIVKKANGKKDAYWMLRWHGPDGKFRGKTLEPTNKISKRHAEKLCRQKEVELAKQPGRRSVSRCPLLGEHLSSYYESRKGDLAPRTMELHRQTGRYLLAFFGENRRLDAVQRTNARAFKTALTNGEPAYINQRKHNMAASTVNRNVCNARTIFALAVDDDLILFNPFDKIAGAAPPSKDWHYVTIDEFWKLMHAASHQWRLLLALGRLAALRRGEILNL